MTVLWILGGIACLGSIVFVLNALYVRTPYHQNRIRSIQKFRQGVPFDLTVLNTGSNHAFFSIDWTLVGVRGFNLASGPQSISWDCRLFQTYRSHLRQDGVALFVLADLVFGFLEYECPKADYRYYYFLSAEEIPRYTWRRALVYRYLPLLETWRNVFHCFVRRGVPFVEHEPSLQYAEAESDARIAGWKSEFSLADLQQRKSAKHLKGTIQRAISVLRGMVDAAREQGGKPVLMVPPMSAVINKKIAPAFLDEVLYRPIREMLPDVPLLDYLRDERFQDYRLYQNGDFMNEAGRRAFMPVLWKDIEDCIGRNRT